jgi:DNA-binding transcriptional regulator YdaS (Cro superfamily)
MKRGTRRPSGNAVIQAVIAVGGPTKAARICGVSNAAVHQWITRGTVPFLKHALRLSRASGIPIEEFAGDDKSED